MGVRMRHPDLPGQEIDVPSSAAPIHAGSGWQAIDGQVDMGEQLPPELQPFAGQPPVRLYHPDLDTEIKVAESAAPIHRASGWLLVEDETVETAPAREATVEDLRAELKARGLPVSGNKTELLERLSKQEATPAEAAEQTEEE